MSEHSNDENLRYEDPRGSEGHGANKERIPSTPPGDNAPTLPMPDKKKSDAGSEIFEAPPVSPYTHHKGESGASHGKLGVDLLFFHGGNINPFGEF